MSETMPKSHTFKCDAPGCESFDYWIEIDAFLSRPSGWYTVTLKESDTAAFMYMFCSLRCMANWLAGELAKEEANGK